MKVVVDKEFLFPSTYPLLFWNRSPQKKFNTSFSSLLSNNGLHHPCPFAYEIHLQRQSLHPRLLSVVCATSLSLPLKEKLPCSASDNNNIQSTIIVH